MWKWLFKLKEKGWEKHYFKIPTSSLEFISLKRKGAGTASNKQRVDESWKRIAMWPGITLTPDTWAALLFLPSSKRSKKMLIPLKYGNVLSSTARKLNNEVIGTMMTNKCYKVLQGSKVVILWSYNIVLCHQGIVVICVCVCVVLVTSLVMNEWYLFITDGIASFYLLFIHCVILFPRLINDCKSLINIYRQFQIEYWAYLFWVWAPYYLYIIPFGF